MIKNITFGQYFPMESVVHKLDPRIKLLSSLALIVIIFFIKTFVGFGVFAALLVGITLLSRISIKQVLKGIRPLWFIILLTFVLNLFFYSGEHVIFTWKFITITSEGLYKAIFVALRLMLLIEVTTLLMLTTSPMEITDALEKLLKPLKYIKFPVHEMAMMMSIAMRFIPTLIEETDRIMKAQTARGAEFDSGNIIRRAVNLVPLLVPLFVGAFKRADELALAMESRCYNGGEGRTRMKQLKTKPNDYIASGVVVAFVVFIAFGF